MPRPKYLSAPAADSAVIIFNFTMVIINSAMIIADLTHQVKSIQHIFIHYILLSLKEQLLRFASCPMQDSNWSISRLIMKKLKPTPQVALRLGGYHDMTQGLRVIGGNDNPVPKDTAILMKIERPSEKFWLKRRFWLNIWFKRNLSLTKALNIRFNIPAQEEFISRKVRVLRKN